MPHCLKYALLAPSARRGVSRHQAFQVEYFFGSEPQQVGWQSELNSHRRLYCTLTLSTSGTCMLCDSLIVGTPKLSHNSLCVSLCSSVLRSSNIYLSNNVATTVQRQAGRVIVALGHPHKADRNAPSVSLNFATCERVVQSDLVGPGEGGNQGHLLAKVNVASFP
jgi:hypothetical protein